MVNYARANPLITPAGVLAQTLDPHNTAAAVTGLTTGGAVACNIIGLPAGLTVTNITISIAGTAANGPTHFWLALLDSALKVLAVSADQGNAAQPSNTPLKLAMGTPYVIPATGYYYVAASSSASTTAPTLAGSAAITAIGNLVPAPYGLAGTQATPPALGAQLNSGALSASNNCNFAAWIS